MPFRTPPNNTSHGIDRRGFLTFDTVASPGALGLSLPEGTHTAAHANGTSWHASQLAYLIPATDHNRSLIKVSFQTPLARTPWLMVDGRRVAEEQTDAVSRFWYFDVRGLQPTMQYTLRIIDAAGKPPTDAWSLCTFPSPDVTFTRLRILAYTCTGGHDGPSLVGKTVQLGITTHRCLLAHGMSFAPDTVIVGGDHIYRDLQTSQNKPFARQVHELMWAKFGGVIDTLVSMSYPKNGTIFTRVCDYQIGGLCNTALHSAPTYFLTGNHDTFRSNEFDDKVTTLPPEPYGLVDAELMQRRYYPGFLSDVSRPVWLPGGDEVGVPTDTNSVSGILRYGALLGIVLHDCRRFLDNKSIHACVMSQWVEDWLVAHTRTEDTAHFFRVSSLPFVYSPGKLGDWCPDLLDRKTGRLATNESETGW